MDVDVGAGIAGTDVAVEAGAKVGGGAAVAAGAVAGVGADCCALALGADVEVGDTRDSDGG